MLCQQEIRAFAHAVRYHIGLGIEEHRPSYRIRPEIVMCQPSEAGLHAAQDDGFALGESLDEIGICYNGSVRPPVVHSSGGEVVLLPEFLRRCVIRDHGVHRAGADAPEQFWGSEARYILPGIRPGLGYDADSEPVIDEPVADYRRAVVRAVVVGVP